MPLLEIEDLSIEYKTNSGTVKAVENVTAEIEEGETMGFVGESGCGKTTMAKSILQILPENGRVVNGEIRFKGEDIIDFSSSEMNEQIRWTEISWIAQNAMNALDPVHKIGYTFREIFQTHTDLSKEEIVTRTEDLLSDVNIDPSRRSDYPHELSGGQRQRVVIALALALDPSIIIADEPTTGLDVIVQDDILELIKDVQQEHGSSMIFISHDVSAVAEIAENVGVMYAGQVVEKGSAVDVFKRSTHPYTIGLMNAFPEIGHTDDELITIPGNPPELIEPPTGCRFAERCPFETSECEVEPPLTETEDGHVAKCHYTADAEEFRGKGSSKDVWSQEQLTEQR